MNAGVGPNNITITTEESIWPATDYRTTAPRASEKWTLSRRWRTGRTILLVAFTLFWDLCTAGVTIGMFSKGMDEVRRAFPLPWTHIFAAVVLTYVTAAMVMNTTTVEIDDDQVSVSHAPVPWRQDFVVPVDETGSVEVEQCGHVNHGPRYAVVLRTVHDRRMVASWVQRDEADYIAAAIDKQLEA